MRTCRACACTDFDCSACIEATGGPCWWIEPDLCSRCAPDQRTAAQHLARAVAGDLCESMGLPGAMLILLDRHGHLQVGLATADHPMATPLLVLADGVRHAIEQVTGVIGDQVPAPRPPERAACIHCKQDVAGVEDVAAIREHSMTCTSSPVVQELQRLRESQEANIQRAGSTIDALELQLEETAADNERLRSELAAVSLMRRGYQA